MVIYSGTSDKGHLCKFSDPPTYSMYIVAIRIFCLEEDNFSIMQNDPSQCVYYLEVPL